MTILNIGDKSVNIPDDNKVRSVAPAVDQIVKTQPLFFSLIGTVQERITNTKHEWFDEVFMPLEYALTADYTAGSGSFEVNDNSNIEVDSVFRFEKVDETSATFLAVVTSIDGNGTTVNFAINGDQSVDENLLTGAVAKLVSIPTMQGSDFGSASYQLPSSDFNYCQIFEENIQLSESALTDRLYGVEDLQAGMNNLIAVAERDKILSFSRKLNNAIIYGQRADSTNGDISKKQLGGLFYYLNKATGNKINAGGATLVRDLLNKATHVSKTNGGVPNVILCHTNQGAVIGDLNKDFIRFNINDTTAGGYVNEYLSNIGNRTVIVMDDNFPKDKVIFADSSKVAVGYKRAPFFKAFSDGYDGFKERLLAEPTFIARSPQTHTIIENLNPNP